MWPVAVALGFLVVQGAIAPTATLDADSARYAQQAYQFLGHDEPTSHQLAEQLWCANQAQSQARSYLDQLAPAPVIPYASADQQCLAANATAFVPTASPRYQRIFSTRPGYPLAVATIGWLTGVRFALWAVPVLSVLLSGLGIFWLLRLLKVAVPLAAAGQALSYVLPMGTWGVHALTEGPVTLGVVGAMLGGFLLIKGRPRAGTVLLVAGLAWTTLVKYSTGLPLAALLVVVALLAWWLVKPRPRGLLAFGGISALAAVAILVVSQVLNLPGFNDTAEDSFTNHYASPDVPNVVYRLLAANLHYWEIWLALEPFNIMLLVGGLVGLWALWRWHRFTMLLTLAATALGFLQAAVRPDAPSLDRLYILGWMAFVVGIPVAIMLLMERHKARPTPQQVTEAETQQFAVAGDR
ncbi:MAG TPA: hypothetical protein VHX38_36760 [Pseudonocardiaceae bacterium]|jgi:hypothetical protein|nr:hypothetical protein [Pseudonocardiaceae bacterium]